jgi:mannosyltransferase
MTTMLARIYSRSASLAHRPGTQYLALAFITLLAAGLRFYKLGEWSFWLDELYTIGRAQAHYSSLETALRNIPPSRNWIPLSTMLTAGTLGVLGTSEWSARLVSAAIGVISIPALYFPIKRLSSPGVALITALLLAVSPWHIYWSQNARFYTSLMLLFSLAQFAFFSGLEQDRPGTFLLSILLLYLATSERLFALFMVPVVVCYLPLLKILQFDRPLGFRVRNLVLISLPAAAFSVLEVYRFAATDDSILVHAANVFAGKPIDNPIKISILVALNIGVPLVCLSFAGGIYLLWQKSRRGLFLFVWAVVPPIILAALNPFVFTVERFVFVTLPAWVVLGAVAVHELWCQTQGRLKLLAAAVLFLLIADAAGENLMYYQINRGNRLDWGRAFQHVQDLKEEGDIVVSAVPEVGTYYMGEKVVALEDTEPDMILAGKNRYWFVIDSQHSWWAGRQKTWVEENCTLLYFQYLRVRETFDLSIYLCDPARDRVME